MASAIVDVIVLSDDEETPCLKESPNNKRKRSLKDENEAVSNGNHKQEPLSEKKQPLTTTNSNVRKASSVTSSGKPFKLNADEETQEADIEHKKLNYDSEALESAAFASRLPYDKMTFEETRLFRDIISEDPLQRVCQFDNYKKFLYIRNKLLQMWVENPKVQLVLDEALTHLDASTAKTDTVLVLRIYKYLERYSYINFGVFKRIVPLTPVPKGKVIVVGAGIAGLMAARQLREFGFQVVIYEARDRIGGRIATFRKGPFIADLGAMVVTGLGGNPIAILSKQISMDLTKIKQKCPIYDNSGKILAKDRDEALEREFNKLLESTSYLTHNLDFDHKINNKPISLGDALELVIKLQDKHAKKRQLDHNSKLIDRQRQLQTTIGELLTAKEKVKSLSASYERLKNETGFDGNFSSLDCVQEFALRSGHRDLRASIDHYNSLTNLLDETMKKIDVIEDSPPADIYLSVSDRQVLDWHFANLEFANATPLSLLSLKHWDQDDEFEFAGSHMTVRNGYSCLPIALSEGLDIRLSSAVKQIKYNDQGVDVCVQSTQPRNTLLQADSGQVKCENEQADAVLVTVPLGCLKETAGALFDPPLPDWKLGAIKRLGFGNLNKIVLCFDKIFWDPHINLFGQVPLSTSSRGELFLFWNLYKAPVLLSLVAGEAASIMENVTDDIIIGRCLAVLRGIFGNSQVPQPKEVVVTRWRSDPWTRGSYSFVSVDSSGKDYEYLGEPIVPPASPSGGTQAPRVFFAGEHTCKNYPATVHGALLSGLREARKISDIYLGSPLATP